MLDADATFMQNLEAGTLEAHYSTVVHTVSKIMQHPDVKAEIAKARSAGVPLFKILGVVFQYAIQFLTTGQFNWAQLVAAIQALINPAPTPTPVVPPVPAPTA